MLGRKGQNLAWRPRLLDYYPPPLAGVQSEVTVGFFNVATVKKITDKRCVVAPESSRHSYELGQEQEVFIIK